MMILGLMLALQVAPSTATPPAAAPAVDRNTIVVIGRDPRASKAALDACIRSKCPPEKDIALSVTHAENQFTAGDYEDAWATLRRSRGRNDRFAGVLPKSVAALRQFSADMATVMGDPAMARVGTIDSLSALKQGGTTTAAAVELKRLEIGDAFARESILESTVNPTLRSRVQMAITTYDGVAARAARGGLADVRGRALLRGASLYAQLATGNAMYRPEAERRIDALRRTTDPALKVYREAADLMVARIAYDRGDTTPLDRLLANNQTRTKQPMLVVSPRIILGNLDRCSTAGVAPPGQFDVADQWVDYDFFITPEGKVTDIVEVRRGRTADPAWITKAQTSLMGRRYLPLDLAQGVEGLARRERFTLVSNTGVIAGSRLSTHCGAPTIMTVDLTGTMTPPRPAS